MLLQELGKGQGYLKAGFLGFSKSGKTFSAVALAIGVYKFMANCGNLAFFDTEGGSEYIAGLVEAQLGRKLLGWKARAFADLMAVTEEIKPNDILIVDSITHPWRELCDSHLKAVNLALKKKGKAPRSKLEFQDWNPIKSTWSRWTDWYLNSPVHVIICGRAGFEYEMQLNEETDKKELVKTGVKMKTESEFGFEPSLLVEMERVTDAGSRLAIKHQATVIGDRFGLLDGKVFLNPKFKDFEPHVRMLKPGAHSTVDTEIKSSTGIDDEGDTEWNRERRSRTILAEEIQGLLVAHMPGQSAKEKQEKASLLFEVFGTRSWTAVEGLPSQTLRPGLAKLREKLEGAQPTAEPSPADALDGPWNDVPA
jgi:AAA domain